MLAGILVAMMLSGAGFGTVCQAACTEAQALGCGKDSAHEMQSDDMQSANPSATEMAGMRNCAVCGSRGLIATAPAGLCGHDSIAEIRALDVHEGTAALQILQSELGNGAAPPGLVAVVHSSLTEPPGLRLASPVSLHTTLRV
jgi:hypothetical protein